MSMTDPDPRDLRALRWESQLARLGLTEDAPGAAPGAADVIEAEGGALVARLRAGARGLRCRGAGPRAPHLLVFAAAGRGGAEAAGRHPAFAEGDMLVLDAAAPWVLRFSTPFEAILLAMPREALRRRLPRHELRLPAVLGASLAADAARPILRALGAGFDRLGDEPFGPMEFALAELAAAALAEEARTPAGASDVQAAHLSRIKRAMETRLREPELTLDGLARAEKLSRRYVQRLFEGAGETFSSHLRERRLELARRDLADPRLGGASIRELALRAGFQSQAHFSRAFSSAFGETPSSFRARHAEGGPGIPAHRGRPDRIAPGTGAAGQAPRAPGAPAPAAPTDPEAEGAARRLPLSPATVHWGWLSRHIPPALHVRSGEVVEIETLTQHALDDHARMAAGDPAAEAVLEWTAARKAVDRRGAGPMDASIFGRGAGEGFGVHIFSGPVHVEGAEPGDLLEVEVLALRPRPCRNPAYAGRAFGSNASAWWGYQYGDELERPARRESVTIYEIDAGLTDPFARPVETWRWTPQTDPDGVVHAIMDYPGVPVDRGSIAPRAATPGLRVPVRPHMGCMAVAPAGADIVDSIPPGAFGGNVDEWRAGVGSRTFLPVEAPGALFSVGDPHLAQGDGEVSGTAIECSLTGTFRLVLHKRRDLPAHLSGLSGPLLDTGAAWVVHGFSYPDYLRDLGRNAQGEVYRRATLDLAMRQAFRAARNFVMEIADLPEDEAVSLLSCGVDFGVTQVVDGNLGVHATIPKALVSERLAALGRG